MNEAAAHITGHTIDDQELTEEEWLRQKHKELDELMETRKRQRAELTELKILHHAYLQRRAASG